jgi:hypothetical protein
MDDTSKVCWKCKQLRKPEEYSFRNKSLGIRHNTCKPCVSLYAAAHHQATKTKTREARRKNHKAWRTRKRLDAREMVDDLKSGPCMDCNQSFHPWQMQFDHRNPSIKKFNIATAVHWTYRSMYSKEAILEEIAKCDLVCANCHADRTYQRAHKEETNVGH